MTKGQTAEDAAQQGERLYYEGDFHGALRFLEEAARCNIPRAMYYYGNILENGLGGVKVNKESAKLAYLRGSELGHPFCQFEVGTQPETVDEEAQMLLETSFKGTMLLAEGGDKEAQWLIGIMYETGKNVSQDNSEAVKWHRMAAEQGYFRAQGSLGNCYWNGKGVAKDLAEAVNWFWKAAAQGCAPAETFLGHCCYFGKGVNRDFAAAAWWYRRAAEHGDAEGQSNLGMSYYRGEGVDRDYEEAVKWYLEAIEQGDEAAHNSLGVCYHSGEGVNQDTAEAANWYRKAAELGDSYGQENFGDCCRDGEGVDQDYAEALKWYRQLGGLAEFDAALEQKMETVSEKPGKLQDEFLHYIFADIRKDFSYLRDRLRQRKSSLAEYGELMSRVKNYLGE